LPSFDGEYDGDRATEETNTAPLVFAAMDTVDLPLLDPPMEPEDFPQAELVSRPSRWQRLIGPILIGTMLTAGGVGMYILQVVRSF
jgi:hypothetical protein